MGPYNEGSNVDITCIATGGRPSPRVSWWLEHALIDDQYERMSNKMVKNVLHLENLTRQYLNRVFTCQATNNNIVAPISSDITIDINRKFFFVFFFGIFRTATDRPFDCRCCYRIIKFINRPYR